MDFRNSVDVDKSKNVPVGLSLNYEMMREDLRPSSILNEDRRKNKDLNQSMEVI